MMASGDGMVEVAWAHRFDNTDAALSHINAIAWVLHHHDEPADWDELMATSGEAFCHYCHERGSYLSAIGALMGRDQDSPGVVWLPR